MTSFLQSLELVKGSWRVLMRNKSLLAVPVIGFAANAAFMLIMASIAYATGGLDHWLDLLSRGPISAATEVSIIDVVLLVGTWVGMTFIGVSTSAIIVGAVFRDFEGKSAGISDGIAAIRPRMGNILKWSIVAGCVSLIVHLVLRREGVIGWISSLVIDAAWAFATLFVIPVLVLKDVSPFEAMRESVSVFKRSWGKNFIGGLGIGVVFGAAFVAAIGFSVLIGITAGIIPAVIFGAITLGALAALQSALATIFNAALYQWATGGTFPSDFDGDKLRRAFLPKDKELRKDW